MHNETDRIHTHEQFHDSIIPFHDVDTLVPALTVVKGIKLVLGKSMVGWLGLVLLALVF